jgi:hypothetical protein
MDLAMMRPCGWFKIAGMMSLALSLLAACGPSGVEILAGHASRRDTWEYPIRLGDARAKVHQLLGNATRTTELLEEYPMSGVMAWFDPEGRVSKLSFLGEASAIYSLTPLDSMPSDQPLMFGLTAHTDEAGFRRLLGAPIREVMTKELRCVWRRDHYVIDALFAAESVRHEDKMFAKGCLVWFEISPGL